MRSELLDRRLGPFENLTTNPRLKRCVAGSTVFKRNLVTNPIFARAVSGTDVVRRNLFSRPNPVTTTGWTKVNGEVESVADSSNPLALSHVLKHSAISAFASGSRVYWQIENLIVGATYTFSGYVKADASGAWALRSATSTNADNFTTGDFHSGSGEWERLHVTFVAVASTHYVQVRRGGNATAIEEILSTGFMIEQRPTMLPFFSGDTPDALGFDYSWEGTAGASTSVIKTAAVEVDRNYSPDPMLTRNPALYSNGSGSVIVEQSSLNVHNDGYSYKLTKVNSSYYGYARPTGALPGGEVTSGQAVIVENGVTFRFGFWAWASVATNINVARRGTFSYQAGVKALNAGWNYVEVSQVGDGVNSIAWDVGFEAATGTVGAEVYISAFRSYKGVSRGSSYYFHGSMTPDADLMPAWLGTVNASASVLRGIRVQGISSSAATQVPVMGYRDGQWMLKIYAVGSQVNISLGSGLLGRSIQARVEILAERTHMALLRYGSGATWNDYSNKSLTAGQWVTMEGVATSPVDSPYFSIRNYGAVPGDVVWVRAALASSGGAYSGPIFHGDTDPDDTGIVYEWEGTEHDSASVMKVGVVEVRRNLATSPFGLGPMDGYNGGETVTPGVAVNDHPEGITTATRVSYTAGLGNVGAITTHGTYPVNDTSATYALSAWVKVESGDTGTFALALIGQATGGPVVNPAAGEWHKLTWMVTPTTSRRTGVRLGGVTTQSGSFLITGLIVERTAVNLPEFDGYHSPDGDLMAAWAGTPNDSESVLYGVEETGNVARIFSGDDKAKSLLHWEGGVPFVRVRTFSGAGGYRVLILGYGSFSSIRMGERVTVLINWRRSGWSGNQGITLRPSSGGSGYAQFINTPVTDTDWETTRLKFDANVDVPSNAGVYFSCPASVDAYADIRELLIVRGDYDGPYFDGDDDRVVWRGTPHASTSVGYPIPV